MPFGNPQRANDATLPLRSCLRGNEHIQLLRSHLEIQMRTRKVHARRKAKTSATCYAPLSAQISSRNGTAKILPYLFAFGLPKANAKSESAPIRANMSRAAVPRRVVCAHRGGLGGNVQVPFLGYFFAERQRSNTHHRRVVAATYRLRRKQKPRNPYRSLGFSHSNFPHTSNP